MKLQLHNKGKEMDREEKQFVFNPIQSFTSLNILFLPIMESKKILKDFFKKNTDQKKGKKHFKSNRNNAHPSMPK